MFMLLKCHVNKIHFNLKPSLLAFCCGDCMGTGGEWLHGRKSLRNTALMGKEMHLMDKSNRNVTLKLWSVLWLLLAALF